jgi:ferritin-like metal-binding protein YciE
MEGVIEEGKDALEKDEEGASFDSGLICAALRTEHYEIAGYEACISMATTLGMTKAFPEVGHAGAQGSSHNSHRQDWVVCSRISR